MIRSFIRTILSPFHGVISTSLDIFTGIDPRPRDLINQDNAAAQNAREEQARKAKLHQLDKVRENRAEQMYGIRQQKTNIKTRSVNYS